VSHAHISAKIRVSDREPPAWVTADGTVCSLLDLSTFDITFDDAGEARQVAVRAAACARAIDAKKAELAAARTQEACDA